MKIEEPDPHGRSGWRRRILFKGAGLVVGAFVVSAIAGSSSRVKAADQVPPPALTVVTDEMRSLTRRVQEAEGDLAVAKVQVDRANAIIRYSTLYQIPADVASSIYDISLSEGVDPEVAFRLVKIESEFRPRATSPVGAIGYTQIQPATAKFYEPGLSREQLYQPDINLRLGFRFLRDLMERYGDSLELALLAYNRGPAKVEEILLQGGDPSNGYDRAVLRGTKHAAKTRP